MKSKIRMAGEKKAEVWLYDEIGSSFWGESISALINLRVNSPGGDVFDATAMYNILVKHPARIEVDIEGMALSAASLVIMAGDTIRMASNAFIMIHDPWGFAGGTSQDLRDVAETMDMVKQQIVNTYSACTGNKPVQIAEWMTAETWMNSEDALKNKFVSEISPAIAIAAKFDPERFHNVPKDAIARIKEVDACTNDVTRSKLRAIAARVSALSGG